MTSRRKALFALLLFAGAAGRRLEGEAAPGAAWKAVAAPITPPPTMISSAVRGGSSRYRMLTSGRYITPNAAARLVLT